MLNKNPYNKNAKYQNISEIMANNELFANSLTYKILWKENFLKVLKKWNFDENYILEYTNKIEDFLLEYEERLNIHLKDNKIK